MAICILGSSRSSPGRTELHDKVEELDLRHVRALGEGSGASSATGRTDMAPAGWAGHRRQPGCCRMFAVRRLRLESAWRHTLRTCHAGPPSNSGWQDVTPVRCGAGTIQTVPEPETGTTERATARAFLRLRADAGRGVMAGAQQTEAVMTALPKPHLAPEQCLGREGETGH